MNAHTQQETIERDLPLDWDHVTIFWWDLSWLWRCWHLEEIKSYLNRIVCSCGIVCCCFGRDIPVFSKPFS